jgi:hypothetical protein
VAVPFGGAYLVLEGVEHLIHLFHRSRTPVETPGWVLPWQVFQVGLFLMAMINWESFRNATAAMLKAWWHAAYNGVAAVVRGVVQWPPLQAVFGSRLFALLMRYLFKPLVITWLISQVMPLEHADRQRTTATGVVLFVAVNVVLNSRLGRDLEDVLLDGVVQAWRRVGARILANLFYVFVDFFKGFLWAMERLIYTVDEWLRFRSGQSSVTLVVKAVLGVIWFYVTYIVRFALTVLIEPQVNPIKHFPVVTVAHKILLPMIPTLAAMLDGLMDTFVVRFHNPSLNISRGTAVAIVTSVIWAIPGIFGFLVWELKENWRLYAANRPTRLRPVQIGQHGETMLRLLRPGFRSGTLPKRFAKLRRALRAALLKGKWKPVRKHLEALRHIESSLHHHVDRELLALFRESHAWRSTPVTIEEIRAGTVDLSVALGCGGAPDAKLRLRFELQSGWLLAGIAEPGWLVDLGPEQIQVLRTALIGFYRVSGADLVRQQIEAQAPTPTPVYEVADGKLVLWPGGSAAPAVRYDLAGDASWAFRESPVPWDEWVRTWEADAAGHGHRSGLLPSIRVLPRKS